MLYRAQAPCGGCRRRGPYPQKLNLRRDRRRQRQRNLQPAALTFHRPLSPKRILDGIESIPIGGTRRTWSGARRVRPPAFCRDIEEQVLGRDARGQTIVPTALCRHRQVKR